MMRRVVAASLILGLSIAVGACGDSEDDVGGVIADSLVDQDILNQSVAEEQVEMFQRAIAMFRLKNRKLPATLDSLVPEFLDAATVPDDPWGNAYVYEATGEKSYRLLCLGSDGVEGGEGTAADIVVTR